MLRTALAGLLLHKARLATTVLAIALGVMFVSGTLVFTGTLERAFSEKVMGSASDFAAIAEAAEPDESEQAPDPAAPPPALPAAGLAELRGLDEVETAGGVVAGSAPLLDADGRALGMVPTLGMGFDGPVRYSASEGALPAAPDEVALASTSASTTGFEVGDRVSVLDAEGGEHTFTVSGLVDFGVDPSIAQRGAVVFEPDTARSMTGADGYTEIDLTGTTGTPDETVREAASEALAGSGADAEVATGTAVGEELAEQAGTQTFAFTVALMLFALVAVFVAGIVIYNTFAILMAQRQREMALLRCVGARRGQVFRSVLVEAAAIGLAGSLVGIAAGIGLAWAAVRLGGGRILDTAGDGAVAADLVVSAAPVAAGLAVGMLVTLVSALVPAVRATRVAPLAALSTSATAEGMEKRSSWLRAVAGGLVLAVSAGLVALGLQFSPDPLAMVVTVGAGLVAFVGVVLLAPLLVRGCVAAVAPLLRRTGVPSMLAADNARRSPRRSATAMVALAVGATLMTGYAVVSASLERTLDHQLDEQFPVDYQVSMPLDAEDGEPLPGDIAGELRSAPETGRVLEIRESSIDTDDAAGAMPVRTVDGADLGTDISVDVLDGDLADVGPGRVAVTEGYGGGRGVGDAIPVATEDGVREYEVAAVLADMGFLWGLTMAPDDFDQAFPSVEGPRQIGVQGADGADPADLRDAVYASVEDEPMLMVDSTVEMRSQFDDMLGIAFVAIAAMLGLSVLIAVFGIANTMALSVLERSRESALLRAMGLTRRQLRRMLGIEAVLLCLIGAGLGVALGIAFGWAAAASVLPGMMPGMPASQIAAFVAVAVVAGLLASLLPARTATRTSISGSLAAE
ncbi:ABC transporter permease [Nocardiopsis coralliicola]